MPLRMDSLIVVSLLSYCTNISFYLILKAKHIPAHNNPVIERLLIYRNLINDMGEVDALLAPQLRQLLSAGQNEMAAMKPGSSKQITNHKMSEEAGAEPSYSDLDEEAALHFYRGMERLKLNRTYRLR
ncbi:something about silencing protein 10-like isoform X1 [Oncorhynchus nerka]|uniref:something about silencing protein 10-like isoform X1 n=1 Tax=Oncorhynchus nerka TaxID=8023 RepID=UPI0031B80CD9